MARHQSYHGNTLGALAVGGNAMRRPTFAPLLMETHHVDACYAYRNAQPGEDLEAYGERVAGALEAKIKELGPENVIGFIAETVVGATLGAVTCRAWLLSPHPGNLRSARRAVDPG